MIVSGSHVFGDTCVLVSLEFQDEIDLIVNNSQKMLNFGEKLQTMQTSL